MILVYPKRRLYFLLIFGLTVLAVFFVFAFYSYGQEEFDKSKALQIVLEKGGPGGCDSEVSCSNFCDNSDNLEVCMNWARSNGVVVSEEAVEKHSKIIREGGPGGCRNPEECRAFCEQPQNHDVCIDHAVQNGFMSKEEANQIREFRTKEAEFRKKSEEFRKRAESKRPEPREADAGFDKEKAMQIITAQGGPGGCSNFQECENFCDSPDNQSACFEFAEKHDLFTNKEDLAKFKRIMQEGGPGGCHGERECHAFCENQANMEVCISFAEKSGLMPPEEIEQAKKGIKALKEGGPAGCNTREACESVCQNPANQEACFEWAKKHGLIPEDELRFIEESQKLRQEFENKRQQFEGEFRHPEGFGPSQGFGPGNAEECSKRGGNWDGKMCEMGAVECSKQGGSWGPDNETGKETCNFPERPMEQGPHITPPPGSEFRGPGGCSTPDECKVYCETHPQECYGVRPPGDGPEYQTKPLESPPIIKSTDQGPTSGEGGAEECAKQGGEFKDGNCYFINQLDRAAEECGKQGGEWRDNTCHFKESPSPSSGIRRDSFFGNLLNILSGSWLTH